MTLIENLARIIIPEVFNPFVVELTAEQSRLRQSGIMATIPGIVVPSQGGVAIQMPFWHDLGKGSDVLEMGKSLEPKRMTSSRDIATLHTRGEAWSEYDLAETYTGSDIMGHIARLVAEYWNRDQQDIMLAMLDGVFASPSMTANVKDISTLTGSAAIISRTALTNAIGVLGDKSRTLTGIMCHSATMRELANKEILDARVNVGDTNTPPEFERYLGRMVIDDDTCPVEEDTNGDLVYTTYIFGVGAIGYAEGMPKVPTAVKREELSGEDILVNRKHFVMHPRGVAYKGEFKGRTPTNEELADGANWERVFEPKNVRIVKFKHKLTA